MNKRLIYSIILIVLFLLFFAGLPLHIYNYHPLITSIIGSFLCFLASIQLIGKFNSWEEFTRSGSEASGKRKYAVIMAMLLAIGCGFVFQVQFENRCLNEIKKNGVKTVATVMRDAKINAPRDSKSIRLKFETEEGKKMEVTKSINTQESKQLDKEGELKIVYSKSHPEIVYLLLGYDAIKDYYGIKDRDLTLDDLLYILEEGDSIDVKTYLDNTGVGWEKEYLDTIPCFINERRGLFIIMEPGTKISHRFPASTYMISVKQEMEQAAFERFESEEINSPFIYYNKDYLMEMEFVSKIGENSLMKNLPAIYGVDVLIEKRNDNN